MTSTPIATTATPPAAAPEKYRRRVGSLRPNSLLFTGGVGAIVDLPRLSVIVRGLDAWDHADSTAPLLTEPRLLTRVRQVLGHQVEELRPAPFKDLENGEKPGGPSSLVGVPVAPFPRWMRCTRCNMLAGLAADGSGQWTFVNDNPYRPDRGHFEHRNCLQTPTTMSGRKIAPTAVPARFVVACSAGHLDEFPYQEYVHGHDVCKKGVEGRLTMHDPGGGYGGRITIRCSCGKKRALREALNHHNTPGSDALPRCRGRHPHLGAFADTGCPETLRAMVLGASNSWFPLLERALYIPDIGSRVQETVDSLWADLVRVPSRETLGYIVTVQPALAPLRDRDLDAVWAEIQRRRSMNSTVPTDPVDLTAREYEALVDPTKARSGDPDFTAVLRPVPTRWADLLERVVAVTRLRETRALVGFTRIEAPEWGQVDAVARAPMTASGRPRWVPAAVTRGEGILLRLQPDLVHRWEAAAAASPRMARLRASFGRWRDNREMPAPHGGYWPGDRYLLLHTLSHLLVREITLECGYASASIAERIYASTRDGRDEAALLLYTSASDSEGTFGGLVRLSDPVELDRILDHALNAALVCSSDPLCAEHDPLETEDTLHGAACHACLFASETTCERGNRFLDRRLVVDIDPLEPTLALTTHFHRP